MRVCVSRESVCGKRESKIESPKKRIQLLRENIQRKELKKKKEKPVLFLRKQTEMKLKCGVVTMQRAGAVYSTSTSSDRQALNIEFFQSCEESQP